MKIFLSCALVAATASLMQAASITEMITFNLSALHAGSTLSGTFTLNSTPSIGDTASATLTFSDPADYSPISLPVTITIQTGTGNPYTVLFSELIFTNLSGNTTPINTKNIDLTGFGFAQCASFPCTATGQFQDRSPDVFNSTYTISPVAAPEPSSILLFGSFLAGGIFTRRFIRRV